MSARSTHTLYLGSATLHRIAQELTGVGKIVGINHEGIIQFEIEEEPFRAGQVAAELQHELNCYDTGVLISNDPKKVG